MISYPNAKINLGLQITEKRPDGFHNLETIFFPVAWCDVLEFAESDKLQFSSSGIHISGDPDSNLVMKAYHLLKKDFDLPPLKIHLHKLIPFGAGLGGGSSDAAFMLQMLNKTFELELSTEKLLAYSAVLGSDCPFFILNKPVFATGRGEIMEEIDLSLNGMFILLVKPPVEVSTAGAYRFVVPKKTDFSLVDLIHQPVQDWKNSLINQFEKAAIQQFSVIADLKEQLYRSGAVYALMSGSGSCVFGLFEHAPEHWNTLFPAPLLTFGQYI